MPCATVTMNAAIICSDRPSWPLAGRMSPMNPYSAWQTRNGRTTAFRNCWTTISEKTISGSCPRLTCAASRSSMRPRKAACRKECGPYWKERNSCWTIRIPEKHWKRTTVTMKEGRMPCPSVPSPPSARTRACSCSTTRAGGCNVWRVTYSTMRTGISPPNSTGWRNWRHTISAHPIRAYRIRPEGAPPCSPRKARYLPGSLVTELRPSAGCPMHADGEAFRRFVRIFGLNATDEANEIAALIEIRARGVSDPGQLEKVSVHRAGFHSLYERRQTCLKRNDIVMYRALGQASRDMAERILRTEYKVREHVPPIQGKGLKPASEPLAGKKAINRRKNANGTPKRRI